MPSASGQNQAAVDGEHGAGDELVLHQVEVCRGDLLRLTDRTGEGAPREVVEYRRALGFGNGVPQRGTDGAAA